jgi:hypothetical protein
MYDLATLTLAHEEHLDDVMAGYGGPHRDRRDSRVLVVAKFDGDPVVGEHRHVRAGNIDLGRWLRLGK